ncbi:MAG: Glutamyl-tRNA(Gln) amidotransferase subunit A [Chlamydiae bacterium]|nr:Glutamyl-tRNA(Gln) amidotransferase subunit A [Chlamydiota bacterium]
MYQNSAFELHTRFVQEELSATEIVECYLKRIQEFDPKLGAFLKVLDQRALQKAQMLDEKRRQGKKLGKLAGIPIAIKDNIHIKGQKTTCGSKILENYTAPFDASVVRFLEEEDAILIGKTNLDEFAMGSSTENSAFHITKNPWDLNCVPGGSSGGSAAAVAARLCPIALGTDTGGSIRQPASFCGIAGFKPTYGRVSRYGLVAFGSSLDVIGPLATRTKDLALMTEVMSKHCSLDSTNFFDKPENFTAKIEDSIEGKVIGVPWQSLENLGPKVRSNFEESLKHFENLGCTIKEVDLNLLQYAVAVYYILATAEASTNLARFDGIRYGLRQSSEHLEDLYIKTRHDGFGAEVKRRILLGTYVLSSGHSEAFYKKAQKVRTLFIEQYRRAFDICDIIATPTAPSSAFEFGEIVDPMKMYLQDLYTISINLAGLPAASIPSGFSPGRKPYAIQLIGPQKKDGRVLKFAHNFEKATQFTHNIPEFANREVL